MKLVGGSSPDPVRGIPRSARPAARVVPADQGAELETVWPRSFDLGALREVLGAEADQVLADVLASRVNAPVWSLVDRGGGRWRPTVSRLAFLASGGAAPAPEPICQVAELLHTGSLIIDDIQDDATERRQGPAAHVTYGVPAALNAANTAYFRALEVLRRSLPDGLRLRALDMLAEELFAAHLGQALDLALTSRLRHITPRIAHYFVLARAKTGALVRIAARLGAIAADAAPAGEAALAEWASAVGVAYQIQNDLNDLGAGMHDVTAGRPTYPLVLALEDDGPAAAALRVHLGRPTLGDGDARQLRTLLARERVGERGRAAARLAAGRALAAIHDLPVADARRALERVTHELTSA